MSILDQKEIEFDTVRQPVPNWIYTRQTIKRDQGGRLIGTNFNFEIEYGRAFLIQNIYAIFDNAAGSDLNIKITDSTNSREILIKPSPVALFSTPGGTNNNMVTVPNPFIDDNTGVTFNKEFTNKKPISVSKMINYMEVYRGNVNINFRTVKETSIIQDNTIIDFLVFGYLVTQKNLEMWG